MDTRARQKQCPLHTTDRADAQRRAITFVEELISSDEPFPPEPITLGDLWTRYQQEAAAYRENTKRTRDHKRDAVKRLEAFFGTVKRVDLLTGNDVERYKVARATGRGWPGGIARRPVRANAVRHDLAVLRTMILWATRERLPDGTWLLRENPLRGVKLPREANPRRPVVTYDRFLLVLAAIQELSGQAPQERGRVRWRRLQLALVLAEATGARIGAIRGLRWSDFSYDPPTIRWRAEFDKRGRERVVRIPDELGKTLRSFQVELGGIADGWLFPLGNASGPWPREIFRQQLVIAEQHAGVAHVQGAGWHAYRRKWATERGDAPLKALMVAGGWRDLQTLVMCYQHPSEDEVLKVMANPTKLRDRKAGGS